MSSKLNYLETQQNYNEKKKFWILPGMVMIGQGMLKAMTIVKMHSWNE